MSEEFTYESLFHHEKRTPGFKTLGCKNLAGNRQEFRELRGPDSADLNELAFAAPAWMVEEWRAARTRAAELEAKFSDLAKARKLIGGKPNTAINTDSKTKVTGSLNFHGKRRR